MYNTVQHSVGDMLGSLLLHRHLNIIAHLNHQTDKAFHSIFHGVVCFICGTSFANELYRNHFN